MQKAEHILQAMCKMGEKRIPLTRVYRCLYSEDSFLAAYNKIGRNKGALTLGTEDDTADGMSIKRIGNIIAKLRNESFHFRPSRRTQIPKKSGGSRPLGIPNFSEKLVQEVLRILLEAYYESRFRDSSHGFRPGRGCHSALGHIKKKFRGSMWFIEGDIRGCFDNINHNVLMEILSRDIHDGRLLNLIRRCLVAGYLEDWVYHHTYSGVPQGGVLSPLLSNIYLHELDKFIEDELIPTHTQGKRRAANREYQILRNAIRRARQQGDRNTVRTLQQQQRQIPSQDMHDPNFRRLQYVRYADDWLLGFIGPKKEAEEIKMAIGKFLKKTLHLDMSKTKTFITHAKTQNAQFLGYAIGIYHVDHRTTRRVVSRTRVRNINGHVRLGIPYGLVNEKVKSYQRNGKTVSEGGLLFFSDAHIIDTYQRRFRGLAEYYKYAVDRHRLGKLKYVMEIALTNTLAGKFRTTVSQVYRRYKGTLRIDGYEYKTLQVKVPTEKGERLVYWGAIPLKVKKQFAEPLHDTIRHDRKYERPDLIQRLQANTCQLCGSQKNCEVHHIHKLADLKKRWAGRKEKPKWVKLMIAIRRKTLVVCHQCHMDIHAGRPTPKIRQSSSREPCDTETVKHGSEGGCWKSA